jgi:PiT family inorganic phosphate transporter
VIGGIIVSWLVTLPVGGVLAALFYFTLKGMFT